MRADSGFYNRTVIGACRKLDVRFSVTVRLEKNLRAFIEQLPEEAWIPIPYWLDGAADVAEIPYVPFQGRAQVRLIVRRVKPTPGTQLALLTNYSYHGCITDREGAMLDLEADHRRHAEVENAIRDSSTESASPICRRGALPPTPPGSGSRSWRITWPAGCQGSAWAKG